MCVNDCDLSQTGETEAKAQGQETNQMATYIMECGGMERIEQLQMHDNNSIYNKVRKLVEQRKTPSLNNSERVIIYRKVHALPSFARKPWVVLSCCTCASVGGIGSR